MYLSDTDTAGEKAVEVFVEEGAAVDFSAYHDIGVLHVEPFLRQSLKMFLSEIISLRASESLPKQAIIQAIQKVVPELDHSESPRNLDQKM